MCKGNVILISVLAAYCFFFLSKIHKYGSKHNPLLRSVEPLLLLWVFGWIFGMNSKNSKLQRQMRDTGSSN